MVLISETSCNEQDSRVRSGQSDRKMNESQLLAKLVKRWTSHERRGLTVHMEIGKLLNMHLGQPTKPQTRGQKVIKRAAQRLRTSKSELLSMCWLGHLFRDLKELKQSHPNCSDWTKFKAILPSLKRAKNGQARNDKAKNEACFRWMAAQLGICKSAKKVRERIRQLHTSETGDLGEKLRSELCALAEEVKTCLSKKMEISPQAKEETPDPKPARVKRRRRARPRVGVR